MAEPKHRNPPASLPPDSSQRLPSSITLLDQATGLYYQLGFDNSTNPPGVVWLAVSTWALAKSRLGATWAQAKGHGANLTWAQAKALVIA